MGTFHTSCSIENIADRARTATVEKLLVDTGSELTWIAESTLQSVGVEQEKKDMTFVMANGVNITRNVGFAVIRIGDALTIDEVVFAEQGDLLLLGTRTLEGLNLTVDATHKKLVASGPLPAASGEPASKQLNRTHSQHINEHRTTPTETPTNGRQTS